MIIKNFKLFEKFDDEDIKNIIIQLQDEFPKLDFHYRIEKVISNGSKYAVLDIRSRTFGTQDVPKSRHDMLPLDLEEFWAYIEKLRKKVIKSGVIDEISDRLSDIGFKRDDDATKASMRGFNHVRFKFIKKDDSILEKSKPLKNVDMEDIGYIFDNLRDIGFNIQILSAEGSIGFGGFSNLEKDILDHCNGFVSIYGNKSTKLFNKVELKEFKSELNDILEEVNDRIKDLGYIFFNKASMVRFDDDWSARQMDKDPKYRFSISYYLFKKSGFKKGTSYNIPYLKFF